MQGLKILEMPEEMNIMIDIHYNYHYSVSFRIQSECGKIQQGKTPKLFHAVISNICLLMQNIHHLSYLH